MVASPPQWIKWVFRLSNRILTFLSLHELADGIHQIVTVLYFVRRQHHWVPILQVILVSVKPHLFLVLYRASISPIPVIPEDGPHAAEQINANALWDSHVLYRSNESCKDGEGPRTEPQLQVQKQLKYKIVT